MAPSRMVVCILLGSCSRVEGGTQVGGARGVTQVASPSPPIIGVGLAECGADTDCTVRGLPDPSEADGGECCPGCGLYEAVNASQLRAEPVCDWEHRGICSRSCRPTSAAPPVARCVTGRCSLDYPSLDDTCRVDTDCASLPALQAASQESTCHLACGQAIAVSRSAAGWFEGLWQNTSVAGSCPSDCVVLPLPQAQCTAGRCTLAPPTEVRVVRAEVRDAYIDNARHGPIVEAIANRNASEFRRCGERARRVRVPGSWTLGLEFDIGSDGSVISEKPIGLASALPDIAQCIDGLVRQWHFPKPDSKAPWHVEANLVLFLQ
jgi:hypothetical protein